MKCRDKETKASYPYHGARRIVSCKECHKEITKVVPFGEDGRREIENALCRGCDPSSLWQTVTREGKGYTSGSGIRQPPEK